MSKIIIIVLMFIVFNAFSSEKAAVLDFQGNFGTKSEILAATIKFRGELIKHEIFELVERNEMQNILNNKGFQQSDCTKIESAIEAGRLLCVKYIVIGTLDRSDSLYTGIMYTISVIDVSTGKVINRFSGDCFGYSRDTFISKFGEDVVLFEHYKEVCKNKIRKIDSLCNVFQIALIPDSLLSKLLYLKGSIHNNVENNKYKIAARKIDSFFVQYTLINNKISLSLSDVNQRFLYRLDKIANSLSIIDSSVRFVYRIDTLSLLNYNEISRARQEILFAVNKSRTTYEVNYFQIIDELDKRFIEWKKGLWISLNIYNPRIFNSYARPYFILFDKLISYTIEKKF